MRQPYFLCDTTGFFMWYNRVFSSPQVYENQMEIVETDFALFVILEPRAFWVTEQESIQCDYQVMGSYLIYLKHRHWRLGACYDTRYVDFYVSAFITEETVLCMCLHKSCIHNTHSIGTY